MAANSRAVSVAIVVERKEASKEHPVQRPVYYVSEVLIESKQRYPTLAEACLWGVHGKPEA